MISFAWPWIFLCLPLPWVVRRFVPPAEKVATTALKIPFYSAVRGMMRDSWHERLHFSWQRLFVYLIWILLVIAAANPSWVSNPIQVEREGRNIMLAIDLSGSMSLPDFTFGGRNADRLDVVKKVAGQFIQGRQGDRVGLIVFGTKPYARTPLTFDLQTVSDALNDSTIGLAGGMTAIGDAIGLSVKRLEKMPASSRVLILMTDGASNSGDLSPLEAAELAQQKGIKIYTIGIGADRLVVQTVMGPQVINPSNDLDEDTLKDIARETGGQFFRAKDTAALEKIYQQIDQLEPVKNDAAIYRPHKPLYPWPLGLALLFTVFLSLLQLRGTRIELGLPRMEKEISS